MKKKPLSDIDPPQGKRGLGKTQFLAQQEEIKLALDKGWSAKDIWQHLYDEGSITIQYVLFSRYIKEFVKGVKPASNHPSSAPQTEVQKPAPGDNQEQSNEPRKPIKVTTSKTSSTVRPRNAKDVNDDEIY